MCFRSFLFCIGFVFIYSNVFCMESTKNVFLHGERYPSEELFIIEPFEPTLEIIEEESNIVRLELIKRNFKIFTSILNASDRNLIESLIEFCKKIGFKIEKEKNIRLQFGKYLTNRKIKELACIEEKLLSLMNLIPVRQGE